MIIQIGGEQVRRKHSRSSGASRMSRPKEIPSPKQNHGREDSESSKAPWDEVMLSGFFIMPVGGEAFVTECLNLFPGRFIIRSWKHSSGDPGFEDDFLAVLQMLCQCFSCHRIITPLVHVFRVIAELPRKLERDPGDMTVNVIFEDSQNRIANARPASSAVGQILNPR